MFGWLALGEVYVGIGIVRLGKFVTCGVGMAVVLIASEPGSLTGVDANNLLLLHLEADVTRKHVDCLQGHRETQLVFQGPGLEDHKGEFKLDFRHVSD